MPWIQIHITAGKHDAPFLETLLEGLGALSVTLTDAGDEPQLEPAPGEEKLWSETIITGLFDAAIDQNGLKRAVQKAAGSQNIQMEIEMELLQDQPWERAWMENFRPMRFGQRLWVVPGDQQLPADAQDAVTMMLDPGLAFGTGTHPTTSLCLQWLDGIDLHAKSVIDYGCGSGILGIAALLLGAKSVTGIDHDPQALIASRQNANENGVIQHLTLLPAGEPINKQCDILLANILASVLVELAPQLAGMVKPEGRIALSGILHDQAEMVQQAYRGNFKLDPPQQLDDWILITGTRK
ncbi:MAG: 50S ribosomal protein L11 methyltransferase [Gammaproteobacteria bacterium]|nr:50S ribosomal protein L11 methyltransferase [Gammaproteobacteria bacterium]